MYFQFLARMHSAINCIQYISNILKGGMQLPKVYISCLDDSKIRLSLLPKPFRILLKIVESRWKYPTPVPRLFAATSRYSYSLCTTVLYSTARYSDSRYSENKNWSIAHVWRIYARYSYSRYLYRFLVISNILSQKIVLYLYHLLLVYISNIFRSKIVPFLYKFLLV